MNTAMNPADIGNVGAFLASSWPILSGAAAIKKATETIPSLFQPCQAG